MRRLSASLIVFSLTVAAAGGVVACGGGEEAELLPGETANEINSNLDQVEQLASEGDCLGASDAAQAVSLQVEELGGVDAQLKQALQEGATRLNEVVTDCEEATTEEEPVETVEEADEPDGEDERKEKPEKPEKEAEEPAEEETEQSLPPQAEGKAKGHEKQEEEEPPPVESGGGTPSGGVGPAVPAEGDD